MAEFTLCPHYLVDYPYENINDIEDNIINCLLELIEIIENEQEISLVISEKIFQLCENGYPWNLYEDPNWAQVLNIWCTAIWPYLGKAKIVSHEVETTPKYLKKCTNISENVFHIFESFLDSFGRLAIAKQKHEEAIFVNSSCCYPVDYREFLLINEDLKNFKILKNSWLRIYPIDTLLPIYGEFKFIPPDNWRSSLSPPRNHKDPYGFIDNEGRVWCWDRLHNNHWDVQQSIDSCRGKYVNVSPEGVLL